jgi:hypothetical protein
VIVLATQGGDEPRPFVPAAPTPAQTADTVFLEIRAKPRATVTVDGRTLGLTPVTIHVPRGIAPVVVAASFGARGEKHREVIPDHDQTIDFTP